MEAWSSIIAGPTVPDDKSFQFSLGEPFGSTMRILVEPSDYDLKNLGDMAMMRVAIERLAALWPHAAIEVPSEVPDLLSVFCPKARPIYSPCVYGRLQGQNPQTRSRLLVRRFRSRKPVFAEDYSTEMLEAVSRADLMVVPGMGGLTDAFSEYAFGLLDRMDLALRAGTPVVMVGQGIGPIRDPILRARAQDILRRIGFISLREARASYPLLRSLGVPPGRITTTGDDSIETAFSLRSSHLGSALGINVRAAPYSGVDQQMVLELGEVVQGVASKVNAPLTPVPISKRPGEADLDTFAKIALCRGGDNPMINDTDELHELIIKITGCRVVLSGSYHAAVFALSVGIPVVTLARSNYYSDKFCGLADQFGIGCAVIPLDDPNWRSMLSQTLEAYWTTAGSVRSLLLEAASRQIACSKAAYRQIYELVTSGELVPARKLKPLSNLKSLLLSRRRGKR